jgi:hypothetical protein
MKIELARLYARTRNDGAVTLSGSVGYTGRLRIEPNSAKIEGDDRSPDFIAYIEEKQSAPAQAYRGPQLTAPRPTAPQPHRALPHHENAVEGILVDDPFAD